MSRTDFIEFLREFKDGYDQNDSKWENKTLGNYLEAMISYAIAFGSHNVASQIMRILDDIKLAISLSCTNHK